MNERMVIASVARVQDGRVERTQDLVAAEAPLAIEVQDDAGSAPRRLGIVMRTPGDDRALVLGLLHAEALIASRDDVKTIEMTERGDEACDRVIVTLANPAAPPVERAMLSTSACGLCGRLAVDAVDRLNRRGGSVEALRLSAAAIAGFPGRLHQLQTVFKETGGLHAAAAFDEQGDLLAMGEDVGRHNAVDKVVGALIEAARLPATQAVLVVSGRVAFEIVQKAALAGIAAIVAVGAPSSLAIDAARATQLTLVGFARDGRFNVYSGRERIVYDGGPVG